MRKLVFYFSLLVTTITSAQLDSLVPIGEPNPKEQNLWQRLKYDGVTAFQGMKYAYSRPLHWQTKDLITAGAFVASEAILYSADPNIHTYFRNQAEDVPNAFKQIGWYSGSPQNAYFGMGGVYLVGLFTNNQKIRRTGVLMLTAASAAGLVQTITKNVVGRARPIDGQDNRHDFKFMSKEPGQHSFPSGHSVLTFVMAHSLAKQFHNPFVKGGIYAAGLIAPVSRLWEGAHWATDIGAGIFLGVVTVEAVDKFLFKERKYDVTYKHKKRVTWHFVPGNGTVGVVGVF